MICAIWSKIIPIITINNNKENIYYDDSGNIFNSLHNSLQDLDSLAEVLMFSLFSQAVFLSSLSSKAADLWDLNLILFRNLQLN